MVRITIYKESTGKRKSTREMMVNSVQEAIQVGQDSGNYYEILDASSGRIIDWNEVNIGIDDGWFYDETELIWKKCTVEAPGEDWLQRGLDWLFDSKNEEKGSLVF